jgi:hypothetical protein
MNVITGVETLDGVKLGFHVDNSVDGTTAIRYAFRSVLQKGWVEMVGYRVACSNGMVVRVPLDQAEFVKPELRTKILELLKKSFRFLHVGDVKEKVASVQYIVEAMSLLKDPVAAMILKAQNTKIAREEAMGLLAKYVGQRLQDRCMTRFNRDQHKEGTSLWSLYNAITFEASHNGLSVSSRDSLLNNSADLLKDALVLGVAKAIEGE